MKLSVFRSSLDNFIEQHTSKAAEYGFVKDTHISMTNELVWIVSELESPGNGPTEYNTALVMTTDELVVRYEYVI